eukprot:gene2133-5515_t
MEWWEMESPRQPQLQWREQPPHDEEDCFEEGEDGEVADRGGAEHSE